MEKQEVILLSVLGVVVAFIVVIAVIVALTSSNNTPTPTPVPRPRRRRVVTGTAPKPRVIENKPPCDTETSCSSDADSCYMTTVKSVPRYSGTSSSRSVNRPTYDPDISKYMGGGQIGTLTVWLESPTVIVTSLGSSVEVEKSIYLTYNDTTLYLLTTRGTILESTDGVTWTSSSMNSFLRSKVIYISGTEDSLWIQTTTDGILVKENGTISEQVVNPDVRFYSRFDNTLYTTISYGSSSSFKWATYDVSGVLYTLPSDSKGRTIDNVNGVNYIFR